jgi:hypothetical protein
VNQPPNAGQPLVHLCLSGSLACSGCNPCQDCLEEVRHTVLPSAAYAAGFNRDPQQWGACLEGYMRGWDTLQRRFHEDGALQARLHLRDVSQLQAMAPAVHLDGSPIEPPVPPVPPGYYGMPPQGPPPPYGAAPQGPQEAQSPQPIAQVPVAQVPADQANPGSPPPTQAGAEAGLGFDPMSANLTPDQVERIMAAGRRGPQARVKVHPRAPDPPPKAAPPLTSEDVARAVRPAGPPVDPSANGAAG